MKHRLDDGQIEVVDEALAEVLRRKTPAQRVEMISACHRTMRLLIAGHLRTHHADWDDARISAEVARRMLPGMDEVWDVIERRLAEPQGQEDPNDGSDSLSA